MSPNQRKTDLPMGGTNKLSAASPGMKEVEGRGPGKPAMAPKAQVQRTKVGMKAMHSHGSTGKK